MIRAAALESGASPLRVRFSWPAAAGVAALLLYVWRPAARYNFDGVACAIAVDLGNPRYWVHGNHVAYAALGAGFHAALGLFGYAGPAIASLQLFSSVLGALGVAGLCAALLNVGLAPAVAVAASAGLAVSRAWWVWSLESQVYPLGAACLIWAVAELLRARPRPALVGVLHGGAILGHVGHAMFTPAAWASFEDRKARRGYLAALAGTVGAGYLAAIAGFYRPSGLSDLRTWLLGSAALTPEKSFYWQGGYSLRFLREWTLSKLELASGDALVGAVLWGVAAWGAFAAWKARPRLARLVVLWLAAYGVLYTNWQPYIVQYHYSDVPALWLLVACAADAAAKGDARLPVLARAAGLWAVAAFLAVWNFAGEIRPKSDPANNADLQRALWIGRETPEDAWVLADAIEQVYVPYFGGRKPLNLRYLQSPDLLKAKVRELRASGQAVYAVPQVLPDWAGRALEQLGWTEAAASGDAKLYRLR